jgi:hypothetical protein
LLPALLKRGNPPLAVFRVPVLFLLSASKPLAVLLRCGIVLERVSTMGRILDAAGVEDERIDPGGGVIATAVVLERTMTGGRVEIAVNIALERPETSSGVLRAGVVI